MAVQHRGTNWTIEEDRRLLDLIEAGKSWVSISANLKRPVKTIRYRVSQMQRFGLKAKGNEPMNIWQIGFVVRSGFSALVIAYLLGYAAHYQMGDFSRFSTN
jgi:hypothetical protein